MEEKNTKSHIKKNKKNKIFFLNHRRRSKRIPAQNQRHSIRLSRILWSCDTIWVRSRWWIWPERFYRMIRVCLNVCFPFLFYFENPMPVLSSPQSEFWHLFFGNFFCLLLHFETLFFLWQFKLLLLACLTVCNTGMNNNHTHILKKTKKHTHITSEKKFSSLAYAISKINQPKNVQHCFLSGNGYDDYYFKKKKRNWTSRESVCSPTSTVFPRIVISITIRNTPLSISCPHKTFFFCIFLFCFKVS